MFYKTIIAKSILLILLAATVTAQTPPQPDRLARGTAQVRQFWRASDGDEKQLDDFVRANFAADQQTLDALFSRMEFAFESLDGHMQMIGRDLRQQSDLDLGPIHPFDEILAGYWPGAHLSDDLFENKLAFVVLLNFPLTTLEERLTQGDRWSRRQWAEARLAQRFTKRIPAEVNLANAKAGAAAAQYVSTYNIWMHHLVDDAGHRLFPPKMRLLEHWNLRDEIKADYADKTNGLARQRMVVRVMERIVDQSIPNDVVDNPAVDWNPVTNATKPAAERSAAIAIRRSPDWAACSFSLSTPGNPSVSRNLGSSPVSRQM